MGVKAWWRSHPADEMLVFQTAVASVVYCIYVPSDVMTALDTLRRLLYAAQSSDAAQVQLMSLEPFIVQGHRRFMQTPLTD
jgi:hypothetical protein